MKSWADHCSSDEESFNEDTPLDAFEDDDDEEEEPLPKEVEQKMENLHVQEPPEAPPVTEDLPQEEEEQEAEPQPVEEEEPAPPPAPAPAPRTYDFPSGPPYTLFVGNLSYGIKDGQQLGEALANVVRDRLNQDIRVVRGKIGFDRQNPDNKRHKGFGYVEVSSLDEMKLTLELNMDPGAQLAGRKIQLDTANHNTGRNNQNNFNNNNRSSRRASAPPEIDGRQFRAGKYNNQNSNNNSNSNHNSSNHKGRRQSHDGGPPQTQRPSLKLQPRTKPMDSASQGQQGGGSKSDIFGGARARDGNAWGVPKEKPVAAPIPTGDVLPAPSPTDKNEAQESVAPAETNNNNSNHPPNNNHNNQHHNNKDKNNRRTSGRGGRGHDNHNNNDNNNNHRRGNHNNNRSGRGGRDNQKGRGGRGQKNKHQQQQQKTAQAPAPAPTPPPKAPAEPKRAQNSFSALAFDDSDSD